MGLTFGALAWGVSLSSAIAPPKNGLKILTHTISRRVGTDVMTTHSP